MHLAQCSKIVNAMFQLWYSFFPSTSNNCFIIYWDIIIYVYVYRCNYNTNKTNLRRFTFSHWLHCQLYVMFMRCIIILQMQIYIDALDNLDLFSLRFKEYFYHIYVFRICMIQSTEHFQPKISFIFPFMVQYSYISRNGFVPIKQIQ